MTDRWDLNSLCLGNYDLVKTDVGPQPNAHGFRCFCCGARLTIQRAVRHLICERPDCVAWLAEGRTAFKESA